MPMPKIAKNMCKGRGAWRMGGGGGVSCVHGKTQCEPSPEVLQAISLLQMYIEQVFPGRSAACRWDKFRR